MAKRLRAFTLTELLAAMIIIAVLLGIAVPAYTAYRDLAQKKRAESHGEELYMAAAAAVDKVYNMHSAEFDMSLTGGGREFRYGILTNSGISAVQCPDGRFDYAEGFRRYYSSAADNRRRGEALICRYMLENLGALERDPAKIEERLRFFSPEDPAGGGRTSGSVESYKRKMSRISYTAGDMGYTCAQAGVIVCSGRRGDGKGEMIYTEYGDSEGYLVICINPAWYTEVKGWLTEVGNNPLSAEEESRAVSRSDRDPVVIVIRNGCYERPDIG